MGFKPRGAKTARLSDLRPRKRQRRRWRGRAISLWWRAPSRGRLAHLLRLPLQIVVRHQATHAVNENGHQVPLFLLTL